MAQVQTTHASGPQSISRDLISAPGNLSTSSASLPDFKAANDMSAPAHIDGGVYKPNNPAKPYVPGDPTRASGSASLLILFRKRGLIEPEFGANVSGVTT
jgi:hypothetical protein